MIFWVPVDASSAATSSPPQERSAYQRLIPLDMPETPRAGKTNSISIRNIPRASARSLSRLPAILFR